MRYSSNTANGDKFSAIIDKQKYIFKVTLSNPDGTNIVLTKGAVKNLNVIDNILKPWVSSSISIDNTASALERYVTNPVDLELTPDAIAEKGFTFRGDGRDLVQIEIIPLQENSLESDFNQGDSKYTKALGMRYIFSIMKNTETEVDGTTCKVLKLQDYDEEVLKESKAYFSTGKLASPEGVEAAQGTNSDRYATTGTCIKTILTDVLGRSDIISEDEDGLTPAFDEGISRLFYSSPVKNTAYDDIMYMLDRHVSGNNSNDFAFLKKSNYTGEYVLESAESIFSQAFIKDANVGGNRFIENFTLTGESRDAGNIISVSTKKPAGATELGEKGDVLNFKFFDTDGEQYSEQIKTQVVNSYDFKNKKFNIEMADSNVNKVRDKFTETYVSTLKGDNNKPYPNLPLGTSQKDNSKFESNFCEYGESPEIRKAYGANKLLKASLLTNMAIELVVRGQVFRRAGTFFSIDREGDYLDNNFDKKMLGMYFLVEVEHAFNDGTDYVQRLVGIKTYHFSDPKFNEDIS